MKTCPSCNSKVSDSAKFCMRCGFNIKKHEDESKIFCPECGNKIPASSTVCPKCKSYIESHFMEGEEDSTIDSFDFSELEREAKEQLEEENNRKKIAAEFEIKNGVLVKYKGKGGKVVIPEEVKVVGAKAFAMNDAVTEISFANDDTDIGPEAFRDAYCEKIILPSGIKTIKNASFMRCFRLSEVVFNSRITELEEEAFCGCGNLTSINLPDSVQKIGKRAFASSGLISFTFPQKCVMVEDGAFEWSNLVSITIPRQIKFYTNPSGRASGVFSGCKNLRDITIEYGVDALPESIFAGCSSIQTITIPDSVSSIGAHAFERCNSLKRVTLPQRLYSLEKFLFCECEELREINIPRDVTEISPLAFWKCSAIEKIRYEAVATSITLTDGFSSHLPLQDIGSEGAGIALVVASGVMAIPNSLFENCKKLSSVVFESGSVCERIGENAFRWCNSLTSLRLPDGITRIESMAFAECESLTGFYIPSSVNYIGPSAFSSCKRITSITIPERVTKIESQTFTHCYELSSVKLHNRLTHIGDGAFICCNAITSITIPDSVVSLGADAFKFCGKLRTVYTPKRFTSDFYQYDLWNCRIINT